MGKKPGDTIEVEVPVGIVGIRLLRLMVRKADRYRWKKDILGIFGVKP
jgi:hypothetical protein